LTTPTSLTTWQPLNASFTIWCAPCLPADGVVVNGLEESLSRVLHSGCWSTVRSFGAADSDFTAQGEPQDFEVLQHGKAGGQVRWALAGQHNQRNALAAIARCRACGRRRGTGRQALADICRTSSAAWKCAPASSCPLRRRVGGHGL
jgi:UDP-N-acetylmuramate-alanine ligase